MPRYFRMLVLFLPFTAMAFDLESPFPSTVPGISIPNAHVVSEGNDQIIRGNAPKNREAELKAVGISHVLIFKTAVRNDVQSEIETLRGLGFPAENVQHIPFPWKNIRSFSEACEQTIMGLQFIKQTVQDPASKVFFHCTVGEDRTGYLAGLIRVLQQKWTPEVAFKDELCAKGYADGDPRKPQEVVREVEANLTPMWLKMTYLAYSGRLSWDSLNIAVCAQDPEAGMEYQEYLKQVKVSTCRAK